MSYTDFNFYLEQKTNTTNGRIISMRLLDDGILEVDCMYDFDGELVLENRDNFFNEGFISTKFHIDKMWIDLTRYTAKEIFLPEEFEFWSAIYDQPIYGLSTTDYTEIYDELQVEDIDPEFVEECLMNTGRLHGRVREIEDDKLYVYGMGRRDAIDLEIAFDEEVADFIKRKITGEYSTGYMTYIPNDDSFVFPTRKDAVRYLKDRIIELKSNGVVIDWYVLANCYVTQNRWDWNGEPELIETRIYSPSAHWYVKTFDLD